MKTAEDRLRCDDAEARSITLYSKDGWMLLPVMIGDWSVPMWASWIGLVVAGGLAFFGLRLAERDAR
jgi:hypothetical protein